MPAYIQARNVKMTFRPPNRAAVSALDAFLEIGGEGGERGHRRAVRRAKGQLDVAGLNIGRHLQRSARGHEIVGAFTPHHAPRSPVNFAAAIIAASRSISASTRSVAA